MSKIINNIKNFLNLKEDFITSKDIILSERYCAVAYEKIFSDIIRYIESFKKIDVTYCKLKNEDSKFIGNINYRKNKTDKTDKFHIVFEKNKMKLSFENTSSLFTIHGMYINRYTLTSKEVKINYKKIRSFILQCFKNDTK